MLSPSVRRTWAPKGHTPVLRHWARHDRLSAISALTVSPSRQRLGLYWALHPHNIEAQDVVAFLTQLRRHLRRPLVLILDRWGVHKAGAVRRYLERCHGAIRIEELPAYAPDLNPTEQVWNHTKSGPVANLPADTLEHLETHVESSLRRTRCDAALLRSFFKTARLNL